jgi:hypothetical protein
VQTAVFHKKKLPLGLKDSPHLAERLIRVGNGIERPGHDDRVDACAGIGNCCSADGQELYIYLAGSSFLRYLPQFERGINAEHMFYLH